MEKHKTLVSTKHSSSGPGHTTGTTNEAGWGCGVEPSAAFAAATPRGRALDRGAVPPQGGTNKKLREGFDNMVMLQILEALQGPLRGHTGATQGPHRGHMEKRVKSRNRSFQQKHLLI